MAVLVNNVGKKLPAFKVSSIEGLVLGDVPGATPKNPVSGLIALSWPALSTQSQAISSPRVQTLYPGRAERSIARLVLPQALGNAAVT